MVRLLAVASMIFAFVLLVEGVSEGAGQAKKAQMVKGTIKEVQLDKDVLIVNQELKGKDVVDRELSILSTTEFVVTIKGDKKEAVGSAGLKLLENAKGAKVQVKCDKDVNVLKVTVTIK
jgi:hypothetical protein